MSGIICYKFQSIRKRNSGDETISVSYWLTSFSKICKYPGSPPCSANS